MKTANTQFIKKHFSLSVIEETATGATYFLVPLVTKKNFVQIISLMKKEDNFVNVQIYLSNLAATEIWAEIDVAMEFVSSFLKEMMTIAQKESQKTVKTDAQFEAIIQQIEKTEAKQSVLIEHLTDLETQIMSKKTDEAMRKKLSVKLAKVEESCIKEEIEISKLTYRYFANTLDDLDPFFFQKLSGINWAEKKSKKKK